MDTTMTPIRPPGALSAHTNRPVFPPALPILNNSEDTLPYASTYRR